MTPDTDPSKLAQSLKAIAGALIAFAGALAVVAADPRTSALLPESWLQWIVAGAAALTVFGGVFGIRNARTVDQAQADLDRALDRQPRPRARKAARRRARKANPPAIRHPSAPHPAAALGDPDDDPPPRHAAPDVPEA